MHALPRTKNDVQHEDRLHAGRTAATATLEARERQRRRACTRQGTRRQSRPRALSNLLALARRRAPPKRGHQRQGLAAQRAEHALVAKSTTPPSERRERCAHAQGRRGREATRIPRARHTHLLHGALARLGSVVRGRHSGRRPRPLHGPAAGNGLAHGRAPRPGNAVATCRGGRRQRQRRRRRQQLRQQQSV